MEYKKLQNTLIQKTMSRALALYVANLGMMTENIARTKVCSQRNKGR